MTYPWLVNLNCICTLKHVWNVRNLNVCLFFCLLLFAVQMFKGSTFWQKYINRKMRAPICFLPRRHKPLLRPCSKYHLKPVSTKLAIDINLKSLYCDNSEVVKRLAHYNGKFLCVFGVKNCLLNWMCQAMILFIHLIWSNDFELIFIFTYVLWRLLWSLSQTRKTP